MDTPACHPEAPMKLFLSITDLQDLLLLYSDASTLLTDDPLSLSLAVSIARLESTSVAAALCGQHTINLDFNFDAQLLNIQVESIALCRKVSNRIVKRHKR